jgi:hypothetical protein
MAPIRERAAIKIGALKPGKTDLPWALISCTLLMLLSITRLRSYWAEFSELLGCYAAAASLARSRPRQSCFRCG